MCHEAASSFVGRTSSCGGSGGSSSSNDTAKTIIRRRMRAITVGEAMLVQL